MRRAFTALTAAAFLGAAGCSEMKAQREFQRKWHNAPAPDFELTALDGRPVKLSSFRGRPVLLAFFAYG
jgi:cytochrome oxidase Cu insertion factor (SCO1/SenC/PrrC family)